VDLITFTRQLHQMNLVLVLLGGVLTFLSLSIASLRWKVLTDLIVPGTRLRSLVAFNLIGAFYSQFLPGSISGDLVKGIYLSRAHANKAAVISSALAERVIGIASNGLISLVALFGSGLTLQALGLNQAVLLGLFGLLVVGLPVIYLGLSRFPEHWLSHFPRPLAAAYRVIQPFLGQPAAIIRVVLISVGYFLVWTSSTWCLASAVGLPGLTFSMSILILAVVNIALIVPISLNGWGVREGALIVLLSIYGVSSEQALLLSILIAFTSMAVSLIGGMLVLIDYREARRTVP
jgi:uncharacterized membrane protein YbhN (UPF0104 family)